MRLPGDEEESGMGMPVIYTIVAVSAFVLIILAVVFAANMNKNGSGNAKNKAVKPSASPTPTAEVQFAEGQEDIEALYRENKLRAEDLDFWNMYQNNETFIEAEPTPSPSPTPDAEPTDEEKAKDGKHTKVTDKDGKEEWIEISKDIPLNTYDITNLKIINGKMTYYADGEKCSFLGVDLSKNSGKVDFKFLKENGIDFVILRLGSRGYESGVVTLDESFVANITDALNAGLEVGVSFFSQAVTVQEAVDEAMFVVSNLVPYQIHYPVVFEMEHITNDDARIDILNEEDKTEIAQAFLSTIENEGYRALLYGDKSWLLTELLPEELLPEYDVMLSDQSTIPDYPYQFRLWKYAVNQEIDGVENDASYIISFVDYTRK